MSDDVRRSRWRSAKRARPGGGCCSSSSASRSAWPPSWRCGRSSRASAASSGSEARTLIAADVLISHQPRLDAGGARSSSTAASRRPARTRADRNGRDADDGAAGRSSRARSRGWWSCGPFSRRFRSTARSSSRAAWPYPHALLEHHGALVRPELLTALGAQGRRPDRRSASRRSPFAASSRTSPAAASASSASGRASSSTTPICRRPVCWRFGSRARRVLLVRVPEARIEPLVTALRRDFKDEFVNARSYRAPTTRSARTSIAPRTT